MAERNQNFLEDKAEGGARSVQPLWVNLHCGQVLAG